MVKERGVEAPQTTCHFGAQGPVSVALAKLFGTEDSPFDAPKPLAMIKDFVARFTEAGDIILDFFSGSSTTAHGVMELAKETGEQRRYILVQIREDLNKALRQASKDGKKTVKTAISYLNAHGLAPWVTEIGKERIRRAGKAIMDECVGDGDNKVLPDVGFRVLRLDSSNMEDIYYTPDELQQSELGLFVDNVKPDRTAEDLLFQSMLELGAELSSRIERLDMDGKTVYEVADGHILACFEKNLTEEVLTAMAKRHPTYAVLRDSSYANDSVAANCEQIFRTYSEHTELKVL